MYMCMFTFVYVYVYVHTYFYVYVYVYVHVHVDVDVYTVPQGLCGHTRRKLRQCSLQQNLRSIPENVEALLCVLRSMGFSFTLEVSTARRTTQVDRLN